MNKMFQMVDAMCANVEQSWKARGYDDRAFSELATAALIEARLHERLDLQSLTDGILGTRTLPSQPNFGVRFGEPPVTLYSSPRFHLDALFWLDGTMTIHTHGFPGAFQVLVGSSIHGRYHFEPSELVDANVTYGDLALVDIEMLRLGEVRTIRPGFETLHAVFHLGRPSVSLVLRTPSRSEIPQVSVYPPGIAVNPYYREPTMTRHIETLELLATIDDPSFVERCLLALSSADILGTIHLLARLGGALAARGALPRAVGCVRSRHGARAPRLEAALAVFGRQQALAELRKTLHDPAQRLLLAVLLNAPDRESAIRLLRPFEGQDESGPAISRWIEELQRDGRATLSPEHVLDLILP